MAKKKSWSPIGERKRATQSRETPPSEQRPVAPAAIEQADRAAAVVGVGASAGGLDAFKRLFTAMPSDTGMAFVLIQHLDPNHPSLTAELLSKQTKMPVVQVTDGMRILPNRVLVIPPKTYLTIRGETLHLTEPLERRGLRVPIDFFFRSLADDQRERAIAIVLTGTGSDGSLGLREIKAAGGMVMVQDPETAQHDGMVRSAMATGLVDYVLPIDKMPDVLVRYLRHWYVNSADGRAPVEPAPDHLTAILALLRARVKCDFSCYKKGTLTRRVQRRMGLSHINTMRQYVALLREDGDEVGALYKDLLIGVTNFFREPEAWEELKKQVIRPLVAEHPPESAIRVWTPGCATGEEAYSMAMLLTEALLDAEKTRPVQVFASDIDQEALAFARAGVYPENIAADVSAERLRHFFIKGDHTYRISKELRETVVFAEQNLISDPPFSKLDLISCRNLMIYLEPEVQKKILAMFHFSLRDGGHLFLGNSETINQQQDLFRPVSRKWRIYRRVSLTQPHKMELPIKPAGAGRPAAESPQDLGQRRSQRLMAAVQQHILQRFAPSCVLINRNAAVLYLNGDLNDFLQLPSGELATDLIAIARPALCAQLRSAVRKVNHDGQAVSLPPLSVKHGRGTVQVGITVEPLNRSRDGDDLLLVTFARQEHTDRAKASAVDSPSGRPPEEAEPAGETESSIRHLEDELRLTREELQSTIEELETSNEEFKAANEEVTSVNEELQSANEELETSKEELQSLNEELQTVNNQLEQKIGELEAANNDLSNFLASADMATIFLDRRFCMKRFTPATARLFRVIGSDMGRPIRDFARNFTDDDLLPDAERVLQNLIPVEKEVQDHERRWYLRRIVPYRTEDDRIDGVVITFADITRIREAQQALEDFASELERRVEQRTADLEAANAELRKSDTRFRALLDAAPDPAIVIDADGKIALINRRTEELFGYARSELIGEPIEMLFPESLRAQHRRDRTAFFDAPNLRPPALGMQLSAKRKDGSVLPVDAQLTPLEINQQPMAMETIRDISYRKRLEQQIAEIAEQERQTLGRELHDTVGQQLSGLSMMVATLKEQVGDSSDHAMAIARLSAVVEQTKQQLRGLARGLVAIPIDARGLSAALRDLAVEVTQLYKLKCQFDCLDGVVPDDDFAATQLFLIAREAANNAARHSHARQVVIQLEDQDGLRISVRDDGRGMPTKAAGSSGMGLRIMEHRCGLIGGALKIEAAPGGGTIASCHLNRERGVHAKN